MGRTAAPPGGRGRDVNGTLPAGVTVNAHGEVSLPLNNLRRLAELDLRKVFPALLVLADLADPRPVLWEPFVSDVFFRVAAPSVIWPACSNPDPASSKPFPASSTGPASLNPVPAFSHPAPASSFPSLVQSSPRFFQSLPSLYQS